MKSHSGGRDRAFLALAVIVGALLAAACSDLVGPADEKCEDQLGGAWEGPVAGVTLLFRFNEAVGHAEGCHVTGSWSWSGTGGSVYGSMTRLSTKDSLRVDLWPLQTVCGLAGDSVPQPSFTGTVEGNALLGAVHGGYRSLPASEDCNDPSDVLVVFDSAPAVLQRLD